MNSRTRRALLLGLILLNPLIAAIAQVDERTSLTEKVAAALEALFKETGLVMAPKLRKEFEADYVNAILGIEPKQYPNPSAAAALKKYYSTEDGIKQLTADWLRSTEAEYLDEIFSIGANVKMKVYFGSQLRNSLLPRLGGDMLNKYATLIVDSDPTHHDAIILLDGNQVCRISDCRNGIRIASDRKYILVIKKAKYADYSGTFVLKPQERRRVNYAPKLHQ